MDVYLFVGFHPIYENIIKYPPEGVHYSSNVSICDFDSLKIYQKGYENKKRILLKFQKITKLPRMIFIRKNCDLIHSSRGFIPLNRKPWIVDIEHVGSFGYYMSHFNRFLVKKIISSDNCKAILPHCEAAAKSFRSVYGNSFDDKIEVMYPAVPKMELERKKSDNVRLLLVSGRSVFYGKGGKELLQAFEKLDKKYDVELTIKSEIPNELKKKYTRPNIHVITEIMPRDELFRKVYSNADIFVLPTYVDSFGYSFVEAMSAGLPLVGTDIFAVPEIIENGKNGFLIHSPISDFAENGLHKYYSKSLVDVLQLSKTQFPEIVNQLVEKLSILIENDSLRRKMGLAGYRMVESGKFSIKVRNEKLKRIYEEALRR
jgi:glycosyltransferase involved in cell wall biosynthesis